MKTSQAMLNSKHEYDLELIEDGWLSQSDMTYLDDAILSDRAPSGDGPEFWNYINNLNL